MYPKKYIILNYNTMEFENFNDIEEAENHINELLENNVSENEIVVFREEVDSWQLKDFQSETRVISTILL